MGVGAIATAFVTIINASDVALSKVRIGLRTAIPASFVFQTTDPATNAVLGIPNTPVDIPARGSQSFVIGLTPSAAFPPTEVAFNVLGTPVSSVSIIPGVDTLLLSAAETPQTDIIASAVTPTNDGIVTIPSDTQTGVFSVAAMNVGAAGSLTVSGQTDVFAGPRFF